VTTTDDPYYSQLMNASILRLGLIKKILID